MYTLPPIDDTIAVALAEDLGVDATALRQGRLGPELLRRDATSYPLLGGDAVWRGRIVAREACVVAGLPVAARTFELLAESAAAPESVDVFPLVAEGTAVRGGTPVAELEGPAVTVLAAERTALDFLMILTGIATTTARWVELAGPGLAVYDTRKTLPGLRALSKYAVAVGGGRNHRSGLYDMVLVKDNHLAGVGITEAVARARAAHPDLEIEVEADTQAQAVEAVAAGADAVLVDNLRGEALEAAVTACREAAERRGRPVVVEASGGIGVTDLGPLRRAGIDRVSSSALTLTSPIDFALDA